MHKLNASFLSFLYFGYGLFLSTNTLLATIKSSETISSSSTKRRSYTATQRAILSKIDLIGAKGEGMSWKNIHQQIGQLNPAGGREVLDFLDQIMQTTIAEGSVSPVVEEMIADSIANTLAVVQRSRKSKVQEDMFAKQLKLLSKYQKNDLRESVMLPLRLPLQVWTFLLRYKKGVLSIKEERLLFLLFRQYYELRTFEKRTLDLAYRYCLEEGAILQLTYPLMVYGIIIEMLLAAPLFPEKEVTRWLPLLQYRFASEYRDAVVPYLIERLLIKSRAHYIGMRKKRQELAEEEDDRVVSTSLVRDQFITAQDRLFAENFLAFQAICHAIKLKDPTLEVIHPDPFEPTKIILRGDSVSESFDEYSLNAWDLIQWVLQREDQSISSSATGESGDEDQTIARDESIIEKRDQLIASFFKAQLLGRVQEAFRLLSPALQEELNAIWEWAAIDSQILLQHPPKKWGYLSAQSSFFAFDEVGDSHALTLKELQELCRLYEGLVDRSLLIQTFELISKKEKQRESPYTVEEKVRLLRVLPFLLQLKIDRRSFYDRLDYVEEVESFYFTYQYQSCQIDFTLPKERFKRKQIERLTRNDYATIHKVFALFASDSGEQELLYFLDFAEKIGIQGEAFNALIRKQTKKDSLIMLVEIATRMITDKMKVKEQLFTGGKKKEQNLDNAFVTAQETIAHCLQLPQKADALLHFTEKLLHMIDWEVGSDLVQWRLFLDALHWPVAFELPEEKYIFIVKKIETTSLKKLNGAIYQSLLQYTFPYSKELSIAAISTEIAKKSSDVALAKEDVLIEICRLIADHYNNGRAGDILDHDRKIKEWSKEDIKRWSLTTLEKSIGEQHALPQDILNVFVRKAISLRFIDQASDDSSDSDEEKRDESYLSMKNSKESPSRSLLFSKVKGAGSQVSTDSGSSEKVAPFSPRFCKRMAVVQRAVELHYGYKMRATQLLAVALLYHLNPSKKGRLLEMFTGEGKSLTVAALAIINALEGNKVDIVTPSTELAIREVKSKHAFFALFGIQVSENSGIIDHTSLATRWTDRLKEKIKAYVEGDDAVFDQACIDRNKRKTYQQATIIYGPISRFIFDILKDLDREGSDKLRGERPFSTLIIDEVDDMLVDQRRTMARLAGPTPYMEKIAFHFFTIWVRMIEKINCIKSTSEGYCYAPTTGPVLSFTDRKAFLSKLLNQELTDLFRPMDEKKKKAWEAYNEIINRQAHVEAEYHIVVAQLNEAEAKSSRSTSKARKKDLIPLQKKRELLEKKLQTFEKEEKNSLWVKKKYIAHIPIPNHLVDYFDHLLPSLINAALVAYFDLERGAHYEIVNGKVVPIDCDSTGALQYSTGWSNGVQQFVQIKEKLVVTPISLMSCYSSYLSYFGFYKDIYGVTGTLGDWITQKYLTESYDVDFAFMPPYKQLKVINNDRSPHNCKELQPIITDKKQRWWESIIESLLCRQQIGQPTLVLFNYIKDAKKMYHVLKERFEVVGLDPSKIYLYTGQKEFNHFTLAEGEIIIATNIAGRGTDITFDFTDRDARETTMRYNGLHVLISFLPRNCRVGRQNTGRTARNGEIGTAQFHLLQDEVLPIEVLRMKRDFLESMRMLEAIKEGRKVLFQDQLFATFRVLLNTFFISVQDFQSSIQEKIHEAIIQKKIQSCLDQGEITLPIDDSSRCRVDSMATKHSFVHYIQQLIDEVNAIERNLAAHGIAVDDYLSHLETRCAESAAAYATTEGSSRAYEKIKRSREYTTFTGDVKGLERQLDRVGILLNQKQQRRNQLAQEYNEKAASIRASSSSTELYAQLVALDEAFNRVNQEIEALIVEQRECLISFAQGRVEKEGIESLKKQVEEQLDEIIHELESNVPVGCVVDEVKKSAAKKDIRTKLFDHIEISSLLASDKLKNERAYKRQKEKIARYKKGKKWRNFYKKYSSTAAWGYLFEGRARTYEQALAKGMWMREAINERWAIWLSMQIDKIEKGDLEEVKQEFIQFAQLLHKEYAADEVIKNPYYLLKHANYYAQKHEDSLFTPYAEKAYSKIIQMDKQLSFYAAHNLARIQLKKYAGLLEELNSFSAGLSLLFMGEGGGYKRKKQCATTSQQDILDFLTQGIEIATHYVEPIYLAQIDALGRLSTHLEPTWLNRIRQDYFTVSMIRHHMQQARYAIEQYKYDQKHKQSILVKEKQKSLQKALTPLLEEHNVPFSLENFTRAVHLMTGGLSENPKDFELIVIGFDNPRPYAPIVVLVGEGGTLVGAGLGITALSTGPIGWLVAAGYMAKGVGQLGRAGVAFYTKDLTYEFATKERAKSYRFNFSAGSFGERWINPLISLVSQELASAEVIGSLFIDQLKDLYRNYIGQAMKSYCTDQVYAIVWRKLAKVTLIQQAISKDCNHEDSYYQNKIALQIISILDNLDQEAFYAGVTALLFKETDKKIIALTPSESTCHTLAYRRSEVTTVLLNLLDTPALQPGTTLLKIVRRLINDISQQKEGNLREAIHTTLSTLGIPFDGKKVDQLTEKIEALLFPQRLWLSLLQKSHVGCFNQAKLGRKLFDHFSSAFNTRSIGELTPFFSALEKFLERFVEEVSGTQVKDEVFIDPIIKRWARMIAERVSQSMVNNIAIHFEEPLKRELVQDAFRYLTDVPYASSEKEERAILAQATWHSASSRERIASFTDPIEEKEEVRSIHEGLIIRTKTNADRIDAQLNTLDATLQILLAWAKQLHNDLPTLQEEEKERFKLIEAEIAKYEELLRKVKLLQQSYMSKKKYLNEAKAKVDATATDAIYESALRSEAKECDTYLTALEEQGTYANYMIELLKAEQKQDSYNAIDLNTIYDQWETIVGELPSKEEQEAIIVQLLAYTQNQLKELGEEQLRLTREHGDKLPAAWAKYIGLRHTMTQHTLKGLTDLHNGKTIKKRIVYKTLCHTIRILRIQMEKLKLKQDHFEEQAERYRLQKIIEDKDLTMQEQIDAIDRLGLWLIKQYYKLHRQHRAHTMVKDFVRQQASHREQSLSVGAKSLVQGAFLALERGEHTFKERKAQLQQVISATQVEIKALLDQLDLKSAAFKRVQSLHRKWGSIAVVAVSIGERTLQQCTMLWSVDNLSLKQPTSLGLLLEEACAQRKEELTAPNEILQQLEEWVNGQLANQKALISFFQVYGWGEYEALTLPTEIASTTQEGNVLYFKPMQQVARDYLPLLRSLKASCNTLKREIDALIDEVKREITDRETIRTINRSLIIKKMIAMEEGEAHLKFKNEKLNRITSKLKRYIGLIKRKIPSLYNDLVSLFTAPPAEKMDGDASAKEEYAGLWKSTADPILQRARVKALASCLATLEQEKQALERFVATDPLSSGKPDCSIRMQYNYAKQRIAKIEAQKKALELEQKQLEMRCKKEQLLSDSAIDLHKETTGLTKLKKSAETIQKKLQTQQEKCQQLIFRSHEILQELGNTTSPVIQDLLEEEYQRIQQDIFHINTLSLAHQERYQAIIEAVQLRKDFGKVVGLATTLLVSTLTGGGSMVAEKGASLLVQAGYAALRTGATAVGSKLATDIAQNLDDRIAAGTDFFSKETLKKVAIAIFMHAASDRLSCLGSMTKDLEGLKTIEQEAQSLIAKIGKDLHIYGATLCKEMGRRALHRLGVTPVVLGFADFVEALWDSFIKEDSAGVSGLKGVEKAFAQYMKGVKKKGQAALEEVEALLCFLSADIEAQKKRQALCDKAFDHTRYLAMEIILDIGRQQFATAIGESYQVDKATTDDRRRKSAYWRHKGAHFALGGVGAALELGLSSYNPEVDGACSFTYSDLLRAGMIGGSSAMIAEVVAEYRLDQLTQTRDEEYAKEDSALSEVKKEQKELAKIEKDLLAAEKALTDAKSSKSSASPHTIAALEQAYTELQQKYRLQAVAFLGAQEAFKKKDDADFKLDKRWSAAWGKGAGLVVSAMLAHGLTDPFQRGTFIDLGYGAAVNAIEHNFLVTNRGRKIRIVDIFEELMEAIQGGEEGVIALLKEKGVVWMAGGSYACQGGGFYDTPEKLFECLCKRSDEFALFWNDIKPLKEKIAREKKDNGAISSATREQLKGLHEKMMEVAQKGNLKIQTRYKAIDEYDDDPDSYEDVVEPCAWTTRERAGMIRLARYCLFEDEDIKLEGALTFDHPTVQTDEGKQLQRECEALPTRLSKDPKKRREQYNQMALLRLKLTYHEKACKDAKDPALQHEAKQMAHWRHLFCDVPLEENGDCKSLNLLDQTEKSKIVLQNTEKLLADYKAGTTSPKEDEQLKRQLKHNLVNLVLLKNKGKDFLSEPFFGSAITQYTDEEINKVNYITQHEKLEDNIKKLRSLLGLPTGISTDEWWWNAGKGVAVGGGAARAATLVISKLHPYAQLALAGGTILHYGYQQWNRDEAEDIIAAHEKKILDTEHEAFQLDEKERNEAYEKGVLVGSTVVTIYDLYKTFGKGRKGGGKTKCTKKAGRKPTTAAEVVEKESILLEGGAEASTLRSGAAEVEITGAKMSTYRTKNGIFVEETALSKIPKEWKMIPSKKNGGTRFVNPKNAGDSIRFMPKNSIQSDPYFVRIRNGNQYLTKSGEWIVFKDTPAIRKATHIPQKDFEKYLKHMKFK